MSVKVSALHMAPTNQKAAPQMTDPAEVRDIMLLFPDSGPRTCMKSSSGNAAFLG